MNTELALNRTLDAIHHLSDAEPPWRSILEGATQVIGGDSATFILLDGNSDLLSMEHFNIDPLTHRQYVEHYCAKDIVAPATLGSPEGAWFDTREYFSARQLSQNDYYVDFMVPHGMRQMLTLVTEATPVRRGGFTVQRSVARDAARSHLESSHVRAFSQALQQAMRQRRDAADQWMRSIESAFGDFDEVVCLVSAKGAVVSMSQPAQRWLAESSALRVRHGLLWHPNASLCEALHAAIARAANAGRMVRLALPDPSGRFGVSVELVRADARLRQANESSVLMRLSPLQGRHDANADALCQSFGLTAAEGRVLAALVNGESPGAHAASRGVSIHTVRKQTSILKEKLGCSRLIDLVQKAMAVL